MNTSHKRTALALLETHQMGNQLLKLIWPNLFVYIIVLWPPKICLIWVALEQYLYFSLYRYKFLLLLFDLKCDYVKFYTNIRLTVIMQDR